MKPKNKIIRLCTAFLFFQTINYKRYRIFKNISKFNAFYLMTGKDVFAGSHMRNFF